MCGRASPSSGPLAAEKRVTVRNRGVVKWFNGTKGFGFIALEAGGKDCFVHQSAIQGGANLNEGDKVEFDMVDGSKGPAAENVAKL